MSSFMPILPLNFFFFLKSAELNIRNVEIHLKICIKLDIAHVEFQSELDINNIEIQNKGILLHCLKIMLFGYIVQKLRLNKHFPPNM